MVYLMGRKKKPAIELKFYEIPQGLSCLAHLGDKRIRVYGENENTLHYHNLFEVGYCRHSDGEMILGEKKLHYENDMISAIPPNYPHARKSEIEDFWEFFYFDPEAVAAQIYPDDAKKQQEAVTLINKRADLINVSGHQDIAGVIKCILEEMRQENAFYKDTTLNLLRTFVFMLMRMNEPMNAEIVSLTDEKTTSDLVSIKPAIEYIEENFSKDLRAVDLANVCSMSETHFRRSFAAKINMPPMDYLNLVRVQKACDTMKKSEYSMEIIATKCGFGNVSTFNRNFKKFLGTSPYQWKKNRDNSQKSLIYGRVLGECL